MRLMHFPKDVTRIEMWGDMLPHAMQVGMMRTRQCCWEVRVLCGPQSIMMQCSWRVHLRGLQLAEEAPEQYRHRFCSLV